MWEKKAVSLLRIAMVCMTGSLCAIQQPAESHFVVHNGARIMFTQPTDLFRRIELVVLDTGVVPVEHLSTSLPRITRATPASALTPTVAAPAAVAAAPVRPNNLVLPATTTPPGPHAAVPSGSAPLVVPTITLPEGTTDITVALTEDQLNEMRDDVIKLLGGEIDQVGKDVAAVGEKVADLMHGTYELPLATLSSQDAARLNQRCAAFEVRLRDFDSWAKDALNDLPVITTVSDTTSLSVLAPLLRPTRGVGGSIGAQLSRSVSLPYDKVIEVDTHMVLNGNGEAISFAGGDAQQLKIKAGGMLTLENITLKNLHEHTIVIEQGGTLVCGDNVCWELHHDMVLESGRVELAGEHSVVRLRGIGGRHTLTIGEQARVSIHTNVLSLQNLCLVGAHRLSSHTAARSREHAQVGGIALSGNAQVWTKNELPVGLIISGAQNELVCCGHDTMLREPIIFADDGHNELFVQVDHQSQYAAMCTLAGEIFLVASARGSAHLHLRNEEVYWKLSDTGSCVIGDHGTLHGHLLHVSGSPIVSAGATRACDASMTITSAHANAVTTDVPADFIATKTSAWHERYGEPAAVIGAGHMVHSHTVQLSNMQGNVVIDGGTVIDWGMAEGMGEATQVRLRNGATLHQGRLPVTIGEHDSIHVHDKNNEIIVEGMVTWKGQLSCSSGSELTITCKPGAHLNLACAAQKAWRIGAGARVIIRGAGKVTVGGGQGSTFDVVLAQTTNGESQFILQDGIACEVSTGATWRVSGKGSVILDNDATCMLAPGAQWLIGNNYEDDLTVSLDRHSAVIIGYTLTAGDAGPTARWSCAAAQYALSVSRESMIYVAPGSAFECNMRAGLAMPGQCHEISFTLGGVLYLSADALFGIADNRAISGSSSPIRWQEHNGGVFGEGLVGNASMTYNGQPAYGQCQQTARPTRFTQQTWMARNIIGSLVNLTKSLQSTLYFVNSRGTSMVQTKRGVVVPLADGERVISDTAEGKITVARSDSSSYTLNASGK